MNVVVGFAALAAGVLVWWLAVRRLTAKPWEQQGALAAVPSDDAGTPPARTGLWVFLAVVTSFFGLFIAAYSIRMSPHLPQGTELRDWQPVIEPPLLWFNTLLLAVASAGMEFARRAMDRGAAARARSGLLVGGTFATAFLVGQWLAWRQLSTAGFYAAGNPANAFFYVLTGLHGLHLLGGLVYWARTTWRLSGNDAASPAASLAVELCTVYWHYLLVVWLVLFGLLAVT